MTRRVCPTCHKSSANPINGRQRRFRYAGMDDTNTPVYICEECDLEDEIAAIDDGDTADWVDGVEG